MQIQPSKATLGATVTDVDLAGIDDADFRAIENAWHRFAVLVFPGQHLSDAKPGDIAIWDNRCVLHRGRPWPEDQPRVMARSTVAGEDPDNEWAIAAGAP